MSYAAMMYPAFHQAEIAASDALVEEAVELMEASRPALAPDPRRSSWPSPSGMQPWCCVAT